MLVLSKGKELYLMVLHVGDGLFVASKKTETGNVISR